MEYSMAPLSMCSGFRVDSRTHTFFPITCTRQKAEESMSSIPPPRATAPGRLWCQPSREPGENVR